jgi:MFS family permease
MFDSMDLNLFTLVLVPCIRELAMTTDPVEVARIGGIVMAIKLFAWGIGGIVFGVAADRFGRARIMAITIAIYSIFTGLSATASSWEQLALYQALAGLGIGGEWAAGAALVAETWPARHRAKAIQIMQMAFAFGFFAAALNNLLLGPMGWRWVIAAGTVPVVLTIAIRRFVPEPELWKDAAEVDRARATGMLSKVGEIFRPPLRRGTLVGVIVASSAMVGSWGGLTLLPNWIQQLTAAGASALPGKDVVSYAFMLMMAGAVAGYLSLAFLAEHLGRRVCYFIFWTGALLVSVYLFSEVKTAERLLIWMPVYGYFVIGGFGTFATYLPELFPTRVRATGQGFCWNMARLITGLGPLSIGPLLQQFGSFAGVAAALSAFFVLGLVTIWFGPETRGRALQ